MVSLRLLVSGVALILICAGAQAQEKADIAKLIVGTWEVTKGDKSTVQEGSTFKFDKDGNLTMTLKFNGKDAKFEATYTIDGDKFTSMIKGSTGQGRTSTIKKITEKELIWQEKSGKLTELKKK